MTDMTVAFLGTSTITPEEGDQLFILGAYLAHAGAELHTSQSAGANLSVINGYKRAGGKPVIHTKDLHNASPWFLLYGDDTFIDQILLRWPNPTTSNGWHHVNGLEELRAVCEKIHSANERIRKENAVFASATA